MTKPKHCKGCPLWNNAGHKSNSPLAKKHNNWCTRYSTRADKAVSICIQQGYRKEVKGE